MNVDLYSRNIELLGTPTQHSYAEVAFLDQVLTEHRFNLIVELGTYYGGLTTLFALHAERTNGRVLTFDAFTWDHPDMWDMLPIRYFHMTVFSSAAKNLVRNMSKGRKTLIYCDNGDKPNEFNTYAPLLKSGDMIMAHDRDVEIHMEEIAETIESLDLRPLYEEEMDILNIPTKGTSQKHKVGIFCYVKP